MKRIRLEFLCSTGTRPLIYKGPFVVWHNDYSSIQSERYWRWEGYYEMILWQPTLNENRDPTFSSYRCADPKIFFLNK
jgi:hypothetical protein